MKPLPDYPSDLTDADWAALEPLLGPPPRTGRPRLVDLRAVVNAIFYQNRTGCQWRFLPKPFPAKSTVFHHYARWRRDGTWERALAALREAARGRAGREPTPSAAILDSQTVKATPGAGPRGYDGGKKVVGRKRHIAVDTLGLLLAVAVTAANVDDAAAAPAVLAQMPPAAFPRMEVVFADRKYHNHALYDTLIEDGPSYELRVTGRPPGAAGFAPVAKRWAVERTFAWLTAHRRLVKDYEKAADSSETRVRIAAVQHLLRRQHPRPWRDRNPPFRYRRAA